jgi:uracil-DNA glycosylase family 4
MRWSERQLAMLREMGIAFSWRGPAADESPVAMRGDDEAAVSKATVRYDTEAVSLAAAEWLVVGDPLLASDATAAEQERLLDNMLAAIGVTRSAPTRSGRAAFLGLPETPTGQSRSATPLLDAAVDTVQPACILALGRAAAQAVLDTDEPLGALRGRRETRAGVPVIATFSPAFLLRHPADKAKAWADLCLAVRSLEEAADIR